MIRGGVTWYSLSHLPTVAVAGIICAMLVVRLYRPQLRAAWWFWRWGVPMFRVAAVVALLAAVLRPSVLRPAAPEDSGEVVVLLDDSPTMAVADASWTPTELVALADALHELPAGVVRRSTKEIERQVARVRPLIDEAARAASELEYARLAGRSVEAAGRHASQARAALLAACDALAKRAASLPPELAPAGQWADAKAILDTKGKEAWAELRVRVIAADKAIEAYQLSEDAKLYATDARVRQACDELGRLSRVELARRVAERVLLPTIPAGAPVRVVATSDPSTPVAPSQADTTRSAAEATDLAGALQAVTRQQPGRKSVVRAVVLFSDGRQGEGVEPQLQSGGPAVIVCRSTPAAVRDVAVSNVTMPATAYVGDDAAVHVELASAGYPAGTKVPLSVTGDAGAETREAALDAVGRAEVDVPVRFKQAGVQRVVVRVGPVAGEATAANDAAERYVKVLSGRVGVAGLASADSEELGALKEILSHAPGVAATVVPVEAFGQPAVTAAQLLNQRVVILDDTSVESMSAEQLDAMREFVSARGGSLILVAGREHWPLDDNSEAVLADLLPYRDMSSPMWRGATGRRASVLSDADASLADGPAVDRVLRLGELKAGVRPLLVEPEMGTPVVLEMPVGSGRVLTVTADGTLRQGGDSRGFWEGLLRYAAGVSYAAEAEGYGLDADRVDVRPGGTVRVRAKIPAHQDAPAATPSLAIRSGGGAERSVALTAGGTTGTYEAVVRGLPAGNYVVRLDAGIDDETVPVLELPVRVRSAQAEALADVTPDEAFLRRVAQATGGEVLPVAEAGRLPAELLRRGPDRPKTVEYALWDSPYLFLFVTACLTTEWALRKRLGLA